MIKPEDALEWYKFGFNVVPIDPGEKSTAVKWQPWLDNLSDKTIIHHWKKHPGHELGAIIDDQLFVLDADSEEAKITLYDIEKAFDITPNLIVKTRKGDHHYFKRAAGTYAHMCSFSTEHEPGKIDIRTGRSATEGRSIVVLPPSTNKSIKLNEAENINDLEEVGQDFIDAIFKHNGQEAPRPATERESSPDKRITSASEAVEILNYISPEMGYDDWLKVLMGLHDRFYGSDDGLYLADEWSSQGVDYPGSEEIEYKWRSFTVNKAGGVTFASVAKMAEANGANLKEVASHYDKDGNRLKSFDELLTEAKTMTPDTNPNDVENLVRQTARLSEIQRRRVQEALKKATKLPLSTFSNVLKQGKDGGGDHLHLARLLVEKVGAENVINAQSFTWLWDDSGVWRKMDERAIRQLIHQCIPSEVDTVTKPLVDGVADLFKTEIFQPDLQFNIGEPETVNCLNGELSLDDSGKWVLHPHCREHYRTAQIPVTYNTDSTAPRFVQFLNEAFKGDEDAEDKIQTLLEMIGYTLMAHCRHERFIILVGSGANGKSVLLSVLEALCGSDNIAGVQPSQFDRSFQRAHLHEKLANIVTEVKQGEVIDDASLKGIVSGEPSTVEHKFKDPFVMRPFSTCWLGTNHMPHTRDFSDALFRRALIIQFNNVFKPELGNCDPMLKSKLVDELPGILNMALNAYAVALTNEFTIPTSCIRAREEWRLEADQVAQFVQDECETDPFGRVKSQELFNAYKEWAHDNGIHKLLTMKSFRDRLTRMGYGNKRDMSARYVTGLVCNRPAIFF